MVIDLGNGLETNAKIKSSSSWGRSLSRCSFVPGSGTTDMNETAGYLRIDNKTGDLSFIRLQDHSLI